MWGYAVPRCLACGTAVGADFLFCHRCGAVLRPYGYAWPAEAAEPEVRKARPGVRTRHGLLVTAVALGLLWIPTVAIFGGVLLSIGSTLLFLDRRPFGGPHRSAVVLAYGLFWLAALGYAISFGAFLWTAYTAYRAAEPLDAIRGAADALVWVTTLPTLLLVAAIALQIRRLLAPHPLRYLPWAALALAVLVGVATVLASVDLAAGLGTGPIRVATVLALLDRIGMWRLVEAPGFLGLAYLYLRARGNVVAAPADASASAPIGERDG